MNIVFDLNHPVDINFFKNAIDILKKDGHNVSIIFRERGRLSAILHYEIKNIPIFSFGQHKATFLGKIYYQLKRDLKISFFLKKNKIDLVVCFGPTSVIAAKMRGIPYLAFDDDFEYKIPFYHANWFSTKHIFPDNIEFSNKRTYKYRGFKELAYLHPNYLQVNESYLDNYRIRPNGYVFIREISNVSLNYKTNTSPIDEVIGMIKDKGLKVVLSLEDKALVDKYASSCIVLEEPVEGLYSLIYYSLFAISSGDTVAREASLLGVPTIYTGGRTMAVNRVLIANKAMYDTSEMAEINSLIKRFNVDYKKSLRENIQKLILNEWDDTTEVILNHIRTYN